MRAHVRACNLAFQSKGNRSHQNLFRNKAGDNLSFMKKAKYIGSFLVTASSHFDRADIVRQKLEAARDYTRSKPVLLAISLHGIKISDDSGTSVHMTHALRRISYATCDPDFRQFAFLAREPKAQPNVQYCHAFVTETPEEAEKLNHLVGEAFRIAYVQQRALLESRRSVAQTQASNLTLEIAADSSQHSHHPCRPIPSPPPPSTSNPMPEADSGIATTDAAFFRQKIGTAGYLVADSGLRNSRSTTPYPHNRSEPHFSSKFSSVIKLSACDDPCDLSAMRIESEEDEDTGFVQRPTSAPHPTPLPVIPSVPPRTAGVTDEVEPTNSLRPVGQRKPTPFSPSASSMNTYDQAFDSSHGSSGPVSKQCQPANTASSTTSSCSSGGGGSKGGLDLKAPSGLIGAAHGVGSLISAPWYQPHIPRDSAFDMLARQPPGSFVVRDSGTHSNCYALSVRVGGVGGKEGHLDSLDVERCLSASTAPRTSIVGDSSADGSGGSGLINHYLIQRTATGVRLKGLEKEWPSLVCLILHLTVIPEMLPCPLRDAPQSSSNPSAFLHEGVASTHPPAFEQAPDACVFRPISAGGGDPNNLTSPPPPPPHTDYQQLSEFSSLLADLNIPGEGRRHRRQPPPPPPARIR